MRNRSNLLLLAFADRLSLVGTVNPFALRADPAGPADGGAGGAPAPTPAGGNPGDGSANISVMPNGNVSGQSAVEQASQAARERLAATGTSLPAEPKPVDGQPRASDGTFAPPLPEEIERENAEKAEKERLAAEAAANGEQPPANEPDPALTVELLGEDGTPVPVQFDDPKLAEQVRERFEIAADADAIRAHASKAIDDAMMIRTAVDIDPVGFVLAEVGNQPAAVEHLVLSLLTQDSAKELLAKVQKIASDPNELRVVKSEQKAARGEYREQAQARIAEERVVAQNYSDVQAVIAAWLPRDVTPQQQQVIHADMLRDIAQYAERHDLLTVKVEDLPLVLRNRLAAIGVDPVDAAQKAAQAVADRRSGRRSGKGGTAAKPAAGSAPAAPAKPAAAAKSGSAFVASAERRKAVSVPGAGAGSPGGSDLALPRNPDGSKMTIEQTIAFHRERLNRGQRALPVEAPA